MPQLNENFLKLEKNYLFINIAKKIKAFKLSLIHISEPTRR